MIVFIKHIGIEGPGTIRDFVDAAGYNVAEIDLEQGDTLPNDLSKVQGVISLGGPMNVYEEHKYPYLKNENNFIKKVVDRNIPFLGICLGSQLLAKAAESKVIKSPKKEIGFSAVSLTNEGRQDCLFTGVENNFDVFQWHEDMSCVPTDGALLASSQSCPIQAFKVGVNAYGLQFHVEITDCSIIEWCDKYINMDENSARMKEAMLNDYWAKKEKFNRTAQKIYQNFFKLIDNRGGKC